MASYINKAGFESYINTNINTNGINSITGAYLNQALTYIMNMVLWWEKRMGIGQALTTGSTNTVTFKDEAGTLDPFTTGSTVYIQVGRCYDASGNNVDYNITNATINGFDIIVPFNCTIDYYAVADPASLPS